MSYGDHNESGKNYQPGLELSNLQRQLSLYLMQKKKREEEELQARQAKVNAAKVGKQGLDYWSLDQRAKEMAYLKDPTQYVPNPEFGSDNFAKRFFTPANKRIAPGPKNPAYGLNDKTAWNEQVGISEEGPITRGVDKVKSLSNDIKAKILRSPDAEALLNPPHTGPGANTPSVPSGTNIMPPDDIEFIKQTDDMDLYGMLMDDIKANPTLPTGGPMTADAGLSDTFSAAGDKLGSVDDLANVGKEASNFSKGMGYAGKALGVAGTVYGGYNLATNWDDMSDAERAQGMMQTGGGLMMATGIGAPVGLAISIAGSIWDLLD